MARLTCLFLLASLALANRKLDLIADGDASMLFVQVARGRLQEGASLPVTLGGVLRAPNATTVESSPRINWFSIERSTVKAFQVAFSQRLLSCASFFRAASGGGNSNDALVLMVIICILIGVACVGCILLEATTSEPWGSESSDSHRYYKREKKHMMSQRETPPGDPLLFEKLNQAMTPSPNFVGSSPPSQMIASSSPPRSPQQQTVSLSANSDQPAPSGAARSNMQNPSGAAKAFGLDREGRPQVAPPPAPTSSLAGHQPNTLSIGASVASGSHADDRASMPKPLCNALVLRVNSRLKVPIFGLESAEGLIPILAESSNKILLVASIEMDPSNVGGIVCVSLAEGHALLGSIKSTGTGYMNVVDRHGEVYGVYQHTGDLEYQLTTGDKAAAALRYEPGKSTVYLTAMNGTQLAHAFRCTDWSREGTLEEYLELRVDQGMDPVLALLCMLGAMVLGR